MRHHIIVLCTWDWGAFDMTRLVRTILIYSPVIYTAWGLARQVGPDLEAQNYIPVIGSLAWAVLWLTVERIQRPHIVVDGVNPELEPPFDIHTDGRVYWVARYFLLLRNMRTLLPVEDTKPLHVHLDYYSIDLKPWKKISHEKPFWFDGPPATREFPKGPPVVIAANGSFEGLCLASREIGQTGLYVFSYDSYVRRTKKFHPFRPEFKVPDKEFYLRVKITSPTFNPLPIWIKITEQGEKEHPKFEVLSPLRAIRITLTSKIRRKDKIDKEEI